MTRSLCPFRVDTLRFTRFTFLASLVLSAGAASPASASWGTHGNAVSSGSSIVSDARVAADATGGTFVAWISDAGGSTPTILIQDVSSIGTNDWVSATTVYGASSARTELQMVADGSGGAYLAWSDARGSSMGVGDSDIYLQHVLSDGSLDWGSNVSPRTGVSWFDVHPRLVSDASGGVIVAWKSGNSLMLQRYSSSGTTQWTSGGVTMHSGASPDADYSMVSDLSGGAYLAWTSGSGTVYYEHAQPSDGGREWSTVPTANTSGYGREPAIATDIFADCVVAYRWGSNSSAASDIVVQKHYGGSNYTGNGVTLCNASGDQYSPRIIMDGCSNAIVSWLDDRDAAGRGDVYVDKLMGNGSHLSPWPTNGVLLSNTTTGKADLSMNPDDRGGATLAWTDNTTQVFGHHVHSLASLDPNIATGGKVLRNTSGTIAPGASLATTSTGYLVVVWPDSRSGTMKDIYANQFAADVPTPISLSLHSGRHTFKIEWTDVSDPDLGDPSFFVLSRSSSVITPANFGSAIVIQNITPGAPVIPYCVDLTWSPCSHLYFGLKTVYDCKNVYAFGDLATLCSGNVETAACEAGGLRFLPDEEGGGGLPTALRIDAPFPNPAGESVTLGYAVPAEYAGRPFEIAIFDLSGRRVASLASGSVIPGHHDLDWNLMGDSRDRVRSGLYFARFRIGETLETRTVLVR